MNKQISLSVLNDELLQVRTTKKEFLEKIERIIPFDEWIVIILQRRARKQATSKRQKKQVE